MTSQTEANLLRGLPHNASERVIDLLRRHGELTFLELMGKGAGGRAVVDKTLTLLFAEKRIKARTTGSIKTVLVKHYSLREE